MDEWLDKVSNDLQEFSDGFSIARDKGFFLGGPDGWSGFIICTLDGKPVVFLLHESD